jgi:Contractile injection system tube protein/LysM domain
MARPTGFQQAQLEIEGDEPIKCWFNPKDYKVQKANNWEVKPVVGNGLPPAQFGGGNSRELALELLFDSTPDGDVGGVTDRLLKMMEVSEKFASSKNSGRPPMVTFAWGGTLSFRAVAKSLSIQYTMFRPDGLPIRAQASLTLVQVEAAVGKSRGQAKTPSQNPTTRATPGLGSHVVRDGDTLQSIAYASYGDPTQWRPIAQANGIDDPMRLRRGAPLSIPRIDL